MRREQYLLKIKNEFLNYLKEYNSEIICETDLSDEVNNFIFRYEYSYIGQEVYDFLMDVCKNLIPEYNVR